MKNWLNKTFQNMGNVLGNPSKKLAEKCTILSREEQKTMANTYRVASRNSSKISEDDLLRLWGPEVDPKLLQFLFNFLFRSSPNSGQACDFNHFAELYVFNVRGTTDERMECLYKCLGKEYGDDIEFSLLQEYCESVTSSYMRMTAGLTGAAVGRWQEKGFKCSPTVLPALGAAVARGVDCEAGVCTQHQVYKWITCDTLMRQLSAGVLMKLYGMNARSGDEAPAAPPAVALPEPYGLQSMPSYPAFIDLSHMLWLNHHLPPQYQHKWRFLFSSHVHGESFSTMAGRITDCGPSLLIIEDKSGHIFGGFAAESWSINANWYGKDTSFLFQLVPEMRIYPTSGFNDHYQYFNQFTKTLPNGILMGGQFEFAAIFLPADPFGQGSSAETCTTYKGYKRLSKEKDFKIKSMEVWGVGDLPKKQNDDDERDSSILDKNPEAKAILELAGKTSHSEGLREPPKL